MVAAERFVLLKKLVPSNTVRPWFATTATRQVPPNRAGRMTLLVKRLIPPAGNAPLRFTDPTNTSLPATASAERYKASDHEPLVNAVPTLVTSHTIATG